MDPGLKKATYGIWTKRWLVLDATRIVRQGIRGGECKHDSLGLQLFMETNQLWLGRP
jgi:hypothetical protein